MTKKTYCPMTIEHEALEMNQAVAACQNRLLYSGAVCDSCVSGHTWDIYDEDGVISQQETFIAVSASDPKQGMCTANLGATTGNRPLGDVGQVWEGKATGRDLGDGVITHLKPNNGTDTWKEYIPDYNGYGVSTASLIQNS